MKCIEEMTEFELKDFVDKRDASYETHPPVWDIPLIQASHALSTIYTNKFLERGGLKKFNDESAELFDQAVKYNHLAAKLLAETKIIKEKFKVRFTQEDSLQTHTKPTLEEHMKLLEQEMNSLQQEILDVNSSLYGRADHYFYGHNLDLPYQEGVHVFYVDGDGRGAVIENPGANKKK